MEKKRVKERGGERKRVSQGGRGHWTVNQTSTQNFVSTFSISFAKKL